MVKIILGAVSFLVGLSAIIVSKAISSCAVYMDDSFRWGGRGGTAYEAIKNLDADDERFHKLLNTIFTICELSGFHLEERIVLKDLQTGKVWR